MGDSHKVLALFNVTNVLHTISLIIWLIFLFKILKQKISEDERGVGVLETIFLLIFGISRRGTIVEIGYADPAGWFSIIQFRDKTGVNHNFESNRNAVFRKWAVGDLVSVKYHPSNPKKAIVIV